MKLLVCGGAGFIGSNFVRLRVRDHGDEVTVLDKLTYAGRKENLHDVVEQIRFVHGAIEDPVAVGDAVTGVEAIVNFAAETHVDRSISGPEEFIMTNMQGTHVLLEAARERELRYLQVSTDEVYGSIASGSFTEQSPLAPSSPYSATKTGADLLVSSYFHTYGLETVICRGSNNYGPYQYPEKLIPLHITNAIENRSLPVYGDGQQRRQWTHVDDFVSGIDTVLRRGTVGETYNVGNPQPELELPVNLEVSRAILQLLEKPASLLEFVHDRPAHDRRYRVDPSKLLSLGWQPRWRFVEGLGDTVQWYVDNGGWWKPLKSGEYLTYYRRNYARRDQLLQR
jgi:dTDP-glucose 4,6-dehydratase